MSRPRAAEGSTEPALPKHYADLLHLISVGGAVLPGALYTLNEVARLLGRSRRQVYRLVEEPGPLQEGLHRDPKVRGYLVRGDAILRYQDSIRVRS